jgi:hypothetical protein
MQPPGPHTGTTGWDPPEFARLFTQAARAAGGISNNRLARLAGVHKANIGRWRDGMWRPAYSSLVSVATVLAAHTPRTRDHDTITALFPAAGYRAPDPASLTAALPKLVRDHLDDPTVTYVWFESGAKPRTALAMIRTYLDGLAGDEAEAARAGQLAGLPCLAAQGGH